MKIHEHLALGILLGLSCCRRQLKRLNENHWFKDCSDCILNLSIFYKYGSSDCNVFLFFSSSFGGRVFHFVVLKENMQSLRMVSRPSWGFLIPALTYFLLFQSSKAILHTPRSDDDPFAVLDPQNWVNPANMTWADWQVPPGTNWSDPSTTGSIRNFNIALITVDYSDKPFEITLPPQSTIYGNPQPVAGISNITRDAVPAFYRDFLNKPGTLNKGHTLHE